MNEQAKHTPGRLSREGMDVRDEYGHPFADVWMDLTAGERGIANARRLVACWNACDGIATEVLENIVTTGDTLLSRFEQRNETEREMLELLEAAAAVVARWDTPNWKDAAPTGEVIARLRAAIAKARGEQQ